MTPEFGKGFEQILNPQPPTESDRRLCCTWCGGRVYVDMSCGRESYPVGFDCDSCPARWDLTGTVVNDGVAAGGVA